MWPSQTSKLVTRLIAVMTIAAGSLLSLRGPAQAYDLSSCNRVVDTFAIQQFTINGGAADFGDEPHILGGPVGTAVICWSPGGRVAVIGQVYADNLCLPLRPCTPLKAIVKIRFKRANGSFTGTTTRTTLSNGGLAHRELKKVSPSGTFNGVNIRVFTFQSTALGPTGNILVAERNFQR